jgi:hypothetical protein
VLARAFGLGCLAFRKLGFVGSHEPFLPSAVAAEPTGGTLEEAFRIRSKPISVPEVVGALALYLREAFEEAADTSANASDGSLVGLAQEGRLLDWGEVGRVGRQVGEAEAPAARMSRRIEPPLWSPRIHW